MLLTVGLFQLPKERLSRLRLRLILFCLSLTHWFPISESFQIIYFPTFSSSSSSSLSSSSSSLSSLSKKTIMPTTRRRKTALSSQKVSTETTHATEATAAERAVVAEQDSSNHHNSNNNSNNSNNSSNSNNPPKTVIQLQDQFPHPTSAAASAARSKKKFRHKRNRSINSRATIPLGIPAKLVKQNPEDALDETALVTTGTTATITTPRTRPQSQSQPGPIRTTRSKSPSTDTTYSIRSMKMQDVATVYHLGNTIFTATEYPNMYRTWDDFAVVEHYEGSHEFCFVVETNRSNDNDNNHQDDDDHDNNNDNDKEIIAFLLGATVTKAAVGTRGYIQWVAVLPPYRRVGIATALIERFTQVAEEQDVTLLLADTPADNEPAIRMFKKAGLCYKTDHVYLTCQLRDVELLHVDEDMAFNYAYTANKKRITIRNMEIDDLYPIHTIGEDIFTKKSANLYNFWDEHLVLQSYLSDPELCAVATVRENQEEKVVGFAFGTTIEKPRSSWKYGYLVWLGCAREYQGMGLASQLYNVMLELFSIEKVRMVLIDTQHNNEGALRFFRKVGFGHDEDHVYLSNTPTDDK